MWTVCFGLPPMSDSRPERPIITGTRIPLPPPPPPAAVVLPEVEPVLASVVLSGGEALPLGVVGGFEPPDIAGSPATVESLRTTRSRA
jgi:hypothetical protein